MHEYFMAQLAPLIPLIAPGAVRLLLLWATHSCRCSMSIRQGPEARYHPLGKTQPHCMVGILYINHHGFWGEFNMKGAWNFRHFHGLSHPKFNWKSHQFCWLSLNLCVKIPSFCSVKPTNNSHMWSTNYDKLFFFGDHEYYPPVS